LLGALLAIGLLFLAYAIYDMTANGQDAIIIFCWIAITIGVAIIAYFSFFHEVRSRTMLLMYEGGIHLYASPWQRLKGFDGILASEDIAWVRVVRGPTSERIGKEDYLSYDWGEIGLEFSTRSGNKYSIGTKPLRVIRDLVPLIRAYWNIDPIDYCDGPGQTHRYHKGKRVA